MWERLGKAQRKRERRRWADEQVLIEEARAKRGGRWCIPNDEIDAFTKIIAEKRQELTQNLQQCLYNTLPFQANSLEETPCNPTSL